MLRVAMACLPAIQQGMERRAAQDNMELSMYAPQQPQTEICPKCGGDVLVNKPTGNAFCVSCDYRRSGKLSVVR